jgi:NTP pyrophosphatase (non-canonical NTP hydrolase)
VSAHPPMDTGEHGELHSHVHLEQTGRHAHVHRHGNGTEHSHMHVHEGDPAEPGPLVKQVPEDRMTLGWALEAVELVDAHLDSSASGDYRAQPLAQRWARVTKVCEEAGEVWQALSKVTGENPRKGTCASEEDLLGELGDTVSAALCAIQHLTKDREATWQVVAQALMKAARRASGGVPR